MAEDLVLDTAIRDWVLISLSLVMVLIGILRYFVSKLMRSSQLPTDPKIVKKGQIVVRARNLRASANFIPVKSFRNWRAYFSNEENGLLHVPKGQTQNAQAQMFSDPNMAMDMMKKNLSICTIFNFYSAFCLPNRNNYYCLILWVTLTFVWVNFFFSGFVAGWGNLKNVCENIQECKAEERSEERKEKQSLRRLYRDLLTPKFYW